MAPDAKLMLLVPALESALHVGQTLPALLRKGMAATADCDPILGHLPREGILTQVKPWVLFIFMCDFL